ncbi:hypothetical protein QQ045_014161 [Rhodiola kirilowii]
MFTVRGVDQSGEQPQKYGWNRTSPDYRNHLTQIMRTTSVLSDVPPYPSVHNVFKNKAVTSQEQEPLGDNNNNNGEQPVNTITYSFIQQKVNGFEPGRWTVDPFKKAL